MVRDRVGDGRAANSVHHNCVNVARAFAQSGDKLEIDLDRLRG